jgi:hypothetical protein
MELVRVKWLICVCTICLLGTCVGNESRAQVGAAYSDEKGTVKREVNTPGTSTSEAQPRIEPADPPSRSADHENFLNFGMLKRIAKDQE